jgi:serine/threonine protein kinase
VLYRNYRIEHKLGHDDFSTSWLAHDIIMKKDVTLKFLFLGDAGDKELSMQETIMSTVQDKSNLITYLTAFTIPGVRGNHLVLHSQLTPTCFPIISVPAKYSTDLNEDSVMWGVAPLDNLN